MLQYYKENKQLYLIFIVWLIVGMYGGPLIYGLLPLTMLLMKKKEMYEELFLGFFFILILSDSLETRLYFAKNVKNIYIALLAVFVLFDLKSFQPLSKLYKTFIPFFLFSFITVLMSIEEPFFFTGFQKTISYVLVFIIVPNFIEKLYREQKEQFLRSFLLFGITALIVGFVLKFMAPDVAYITSGRFRSIMGNPNGLGLYTVLFFILFFVVNDLFPKLFSKFEIRLFYGVILYSIILSGSRNAMFALILFLLFQRFFSLSPFLGFIIFIIFIILSEIISSNLDTIVLSLGLDSFFRLETLDNGSGRYIAWDFAWKQIQQNFFVGKGFAYDEYYMQINYQKLSDLGHQGGVHNSFLSFWMDQGLIGLVIYLRSYILMFIKAAKKTKFAFPIMFALALSATFESWMLGSLSSFAFLALFIYTVISSEEIIAQPMEEKLFN